jgi:hypothetical protein
MESGKLAKRSAADRLSNAGDPDVGGEVAARAFARFDAGVNPRDVVSELAVDPETVDYLWRTWARLRGMVIISAENLQALATALHASRAPEAPAEFVRLVQQLCAEEQDACARCGRDVAEYCYTCPGQAAIEAREQKRRRPRRGSRRGG